MQAALNGLYDFGSQGCRFEPCRVQVSTVHVLINIDKRRNESRNFSVSQSLAIFEAQNEKLSCHVRLHPHVPLSIDSPVFIAPQFDSGVFDDSPTVMQNAGVVLDDRQTRPSCQTPFCRPLSGRTFRGP